MTHYNYLLIKTKTQPRLRLTIYMIIIGAIFHGRKALKIGFPTMLSTEISDKM